MNEPNEERIEDQVSQETPEADGTQETVQEETPAVTEKAAFSIGRCIKKALQVTFVFSAIALLLIAGLDFAETAKVYASCKEDTVGYVSDYYSDSHKSLKSLSGDLTPEKMYPVIRYTVGEETFTRHSSTEVGEWPYETGIKLQIKYNAFKPEVSIIKVEVFSAMANFAVKAGIALLLFAVAGFLKPKTKKKDADE